MESNNIAIYPGTFDPITLGHIDIVERSTKIFDKVYVVIGINSSKKNLFNENERLIMTKESLKHLTNVEVVINSGLTVDIATQLGASTIIRGVRAISDFDYEFQIALTNRKISSNIDTIFLLPDERFTYLSSTIVRELAQFGENIKCFVNDFVADKLTEKFGNTTINKSIIV